MANDRHSGTEDGAEFTELEVSEEDVRAAQLQEARRFMPFALAGASSPAWRWWTSSGMSRRSRPRDDGASWGLRRPRPEVGRGSVKSQALKERCSAAPLGGRQA